jgi:hypothetical protein
MITITTVIAGDKKFKKFVDKSVKYSKNVGYETLVYDLGELGYGTKFNTTLEVSSRIPLKPHIIREALNQVADGNFLVWIDADALIEERIDEIVGDYDIGVTVRLPKLKENSTPINAGVIFVKKTHNSIAFLEQWMKESEVIGDDQIALCNLCQVTTQDRENTVYRNNIKVRVFPCEIYNNFYFGKKPNKHPAKIKHYKSKLRNLWPE